MPHVLVIHDVDDYSVWKEAFDTASGLLREAGELEFQVLVDTANPDRVVHFARWESVEKARAFFQSREVEEIRRRAGVRSPDFIYLDLKDSGIR
jgi:heme-degrading monooxygenase HmoA